MRVTNQEAIALHAEANKSDPFAGRRMSMILRRRLDDPASVAAEATRTLHARRASIEAEFKAWKKANEPQPTLGDILRSALDKQHAVAAAA